MDRTQSTLTALLLNPFLTHEEAEREAVAISYTVARRVEPSVLRRDPRPRRVLADRDTGEVSIGT